MSQARGTRGCARWRSRRDGSSSLVVLLVSGRVKGIEGDKRGARVMPRGQGARDACACVKLLVHGFSWRKFKVGCLSLRECLKATDTPL
jgi:hypothetical protein